MDNIMMINEMEHLMKVMEIQQNIMSERTLMMKYFTDVNSIQLTIIYLQGKNISEKNLRPYFNELEFAQQKLTKIEQNIIQFEDQIELLEFI